MAQERDSVAASKDRNWYALRVKTGSERLIAAIARQKGYEEFVPVFRARRCWSDRNKTVELPLFPGYVFCRLNPAFRLPLLVIPGVLHFVGIRNTPMAMDEAEVAAIRLATQSGLRTEPWPYLESGQRLKVQVGPLAPLEGLLVQTPDECRVVVSMSLLKRSIAVEIEAGWIGPRRADESTSASPCPGRRQKRDRRKDVKDNPQTV